MIGLRVAHTYYTHSLSLPHRKWGYKFGTENNCCITSNLAVHAFSIMMKFGDALFFRGGDLVIKDDND